MSIKETVMGILRSGAALSAAMTIGATGGYIMYKDNQRFPRMMTAYSKGNILPPLADNRFEVTYFKRPKAERILRDMMSSKFSNEYYLVSGEVGSGKTRLITEIIRQMMTENTNQGAPIYVTVTQGKSFAESLAAAVNFCFDEHISFKFFTDFVLGIHSFPQRDEQHRLTRTLDAIEKSAFQYVEKTGRPVVLVVDGANSLSEHMPVVLHKLQEKAKLWADTNIVKMVFVSNDEKTESEMQLRSSAWSRAATPIHIGDLSDPEAQSFLTRAEFLCDSPVSDPMSDEDADSIVSLVGGRINHLIAFKRDHLNGVEKSLTTKELLSREREKFLAVSRVPARWRVVDTLHKAPQKMLKLSTLCERTSPEDVQALLESNIIRIERRGRGLTARFESRLAEKVVEEFE